MTTRADETHATLELMVGSIDPIELELVAENDEAEDLGAADGGRLTVTASLEAGVTPILDKGSDGGGFAFGADGVVTITLSQAEADALEAGFYLAQVAVRFGSTWRKSRPFYADVHSAITTNATT